MRYWLELFSYVGLHKCSKVVRNYYFKEYHQEHTQYMNPLALLEPHIRGRGLMLMCSLLKLAIFYVLKRLHVYIIYLFILLPLY